jgi:hypothetical protein
MSIIRRYRDGKIITIDISKQQTTSNPQSPTIPNVTPPPAQPQVSPSITPSAPKKGCGCGKKK